MKTLSYIYLVTCLVLINGCVGTIEEKSGIDNSSEVKTGEFNFEGAFDAKGISHDKIVVRFRPATKGSNRFNYQIYQNGGEVPVASVDGETALLDFEGYIATTVSGLAKGQSYSYQVLAFDKETGYNDGNQVFVTGTTYTNNVPLFEGAIAVENLAGLAGETQLKVKWNVALPSTENFNPFVSDPNAISGYNIYIGTSEANIALANSLSDPEATEFILAGLNPGTTYFINVKAKDSNSPQREDGNTVYIPKATRTPEAINFSGIDSINLSTTPNAASGFSKFDIAWTPGTGSFDRYRLFVSTTPKVSFTPGIDSPHLAIPAGDITDLSTSSMTVNVSNANTTHYVAIIACRDVSCTQYQGHTKVLNITTRPAVAPFNGISSIDFPTGTDSLTSLNLNWMLPDISLGVYDEIRIYRSAPDGTYDAIADRIYTYNDGSGLPGIDLTNSTSNKVRIKGLTTNTQYCFVAKAYSISPFDPSYPLGRTHTNEVFQCATPSIVTPGFGGVNNSCSNITSSSLTVTWNNPNPMGTFSYYEIYYKTGASSFDFNDAVNTPYTTLIAFPGQNSYSLTGLSPNTNYQIGMRTYFLNPVSSLVTRDSNLSVANCQTDQVKAIHNGWADLIALGPKRNGIDGQLKMESFTTHRTPDAIDGFYKNKYPKENPLGTQGTDASNQGMVFIAWDDFELDGLGKLQPFANANSGYNIYRKAWTVSHDTAPPGLITDNSPNPWVKLNNNVIQPEAINYKGNPRYFGAWTDYNFDRSSAARNDAQIYFYKVVAVINGNEVSFLSEYGDGVLKVVVPPENMSLVHRWIANKGMCEEIKRDYDRDQNYSCIYDGIGTTFGRYDIGKSILYDRFELGSNFTRGNENGGGCSSAHPDFEGTGNPGTNTMVGDCVTFSPASVTSITAQKDSVLLVRGHINSTYLNTSAVSGNTWTLIQSLEPAATHESGSIFPLNHVNHPLGTGLGSIMASNEAGLSPLFRLPASTSNHVCRSFDVNVGSSTYLKRLPRKREYAAAILNSPYMNDTSNSQVMFASVPTTTSVLDRSCFVNSTVRYGGSATPISLDLKSVNYPNSFHSVTGSSGPFSSEGCVSRFGIQDLSGNAYEPMSDLAACNSAWGCTWAWTDNTETTSIDTVTPFEAGSREGMRNGDGRYFDNYIANGIGAYTTDGWIGTAANYMSPILAVGLSCNGSACNNGNDDNIRFSQKTSAAVPTAEFNNYIVNYGNWAYGGRLTLGAPAVTNYYVMMTGGHPTSGGYAGPYMQILSQYSTINTYVGRCATPIDE